MTETEIQQHIDAAIARDRYGRHSHAEGREPFWALVKRHKDIEKLRAKLESADDRLRRVLDDIESRTEEIPAVTS